MRLFKILITIVVLITGLLFWFQLDTISYLQKDGNEMKIDINNGVNNVIVISDSLNRLKESKYFVNHIENKLDKQDDSLRTSTITSVVLIVLYVISIVLLVGKKKIFQHMR